MATSQNRSFLKYTGLTYADILKQVNDRLKADKRFDNFRESAIAQTMVEIFAGAADLVNYYIERQAEESFFETSQRTSSAILNSRNLAYDITRPIPATADITINIKGYMVGKITANSKIQFPVFSKFSYQGVDFILKKGFTYTFTQKDQQDAIDGGDNFEMDITADDNGDPITIIEGTLKTKIIDGTQNPQVGQIFQTYIIEDATFSNLYGDADLTGYPTTTVYVGSNNTDPNNKYLIDRRSLINNTTIADVTANVTPQVKCCVIRTAINGNAELKFGSAKIANLGAEVNNVPATTFDNIYVQYLSTIGSKANQVGVIGEYVTYSSQVVIANTPWDITGNTLFVFNKNITGGGDLETADSIKTNAPAIFYSLDRAVDVKDHVNVLKALTSPIRIRNALAWGEQEEARARNVSAIVELFNVGFFSCIGTLYNVDGDPVNDTFSVRTNANRLDESVLDDNFDEDAMMSQYYFNIFVKNKVARQIKETVTVTHYWYINEYVPVTKTAYDLKQTYSSSASIYYWYTSDKYLTDQEPNDFINIDMSGISTSSNDGGMNEIANLMETAFRAKLDMRSYVLSGEEQNPNWNKPQFPLLTVLWDSLKKEFTIQTDPSDVCYIDYIDTDATGELATDLGFNNGGDVYAHSVSININGNLISSKILEVYNYLTQRGQITIRYLYASPLTHSFRLTGTIYVDQLFSVDDLHREVNNAVYQFLDTKTDFNVPIYKSNIIDIIENFDGIDHADVNILPDIPFPVKDPSYRVTFFFPYAAYYTTINKYGVEAEAIYICVFKTLNKYFGRTFATDPGDAIASVMNGEARSIWSTYITVARGYTPDNLQEMNGTIPTEPYPDPPYPSHPYLKKTTERYFLDTIVKFMYDTMVTDLGASGDVTKFQDTSDFITLVSDLHKDLLWTIRCNMIDVNGNIAPQYAITTNTFGLDTKTLERGGYTLGCEIAKLNLESVSQENNTPYLNYLYK